MSHQTATSTNTSIASRNSNRVAVSVDQLIIGKRIHFPIHDQKGILLLADGSVISEGFKRLLNARGLTQVQVHPEDAAAITDHSQRPIITQPHQAHTSSSEPDSLIESGLPYVSNKGPAIRDRKMKHGCKRYDQELKSVIANQRHIAGQQLAEQLQLTIQGAELSGEQIVETTSQYIRLMTLDTDCLLNTGIKDKPQLIERCQELSLLGMAIGLEMGLNAENVTRIGVAGLLHDWGLLFVSESIRNADHPLSASELLEYHKHPIYSLNMLEKNTGLPTLVPMISYQVHEKLDGSGFPRRRTEQNIHVFSRILHVADAYISLTCGDFGQPALTPYSAMEILLRQAHDRKIDPIVLRGLLRVKTLFPVGSYVVLSDSSIGIVHRANGDHYTQPIVKLIRDKRGQQIDGDSESSIIDLSAAELNIAQALPTPGRKEIVANPAQYQLSTPTVAWRTHTAATHSVPVPRSRRYPTHKTQRPKVIRASK